MSHVIVCFRQGLAIGIGPDEPQCWTSAESWIKRMHPEHIDVFGSQWPVGFHTWRDRYRLLSSHGYEMRAEMLAGNDGWIDVAERLPDDDIVVLIATKNTSEPVWLGWHGEHGWESATDAFPIDGLVTHWQPLPGPRC